MKKQSKFLALVLVLALFAAMAMGSGSSSSGEVKAPASVSGSDGAGKENPAAPQQQTEAAKSGATIEETVLVDQKDIRITAKSLETGGIFGPGIKLLIENNTDKSLTVQARSASVNGYMVETMMSCDVAAGKKANDDLTFMNSDLTAANITVIADMEMSFHIFYSDNWETYLDTEPVKLATSAAADYTYTYDNSGFSAYSDKGVEIVVKGMAESGSWLGPAIQVYIYNGSDRGIDIQTRDVSIDGFMVDAIFSSEVAPGKHCIDAITFLSSDLEANGIEKISQVELSFHILDSSNWNTIADTAPVTITFE